MVAVAVLDVIVLQIPLPVDLVVVWEVEILHLLPFELEILHHIPQHKEILVEIMEGLLPQAVVVVLVVLELMQQDQDPEIRLETVV
jgi:hypothetical protein|tara:strand:+ start:167 stop:424 length:258 start_codon:yes stop_codon:yes gene_type:complete